MKFLRVARYNATLGGGRSILLSYGNICFILPHTGQKYKPADTKRLRFSPCIRGIRVFSL